MLAYTRWSLLVRSKQVTTLHKWVIVTCLRPMHIDASFAFDLLPCLSPGVDKHGFHRQPDPLEKPHHNSHNLSPALPPPPHLVIRHRLPLKVFRFPAPVAHDLLVHCPRAPGPRLMEDLKRLHLKGVSFHFPVGLHWSRRQESNPRASVHKTVALPSELRRHPSQLPIQVRHQIPQHTSRPLVPVRNGRGKLALQPGSFILELFHFVSRSHE